MSSPSPLGGFQSFAFCDFTKCISETIIQISWGGGVGGAVKNSSTPLWGHLEASGSEILRKERKINHAGWEKNSWHQHSHLVIRQILMMWTSREHSDIWKIHLLAITDQAGLTDASLKHAESYTKTLLRIYFFSETNPLMLKIRHLLHFFLLKESAQGMSMHLGAYNYVRFATVEWSNAQ